LIVPKEGDLINLNGLMLIVRNLDKHNKVLEAADVNKHSYFVDFKDVKILMQEPDAEWQYYVEDYKNWDVLLEDARLKGVIVC